MAMIEREADDTDELPWPAEADPEADEDYEVEHFKF
jgi:hypothetical protein